MRAYDEPVEADPQVIALQVLPRLVCICRNHLKLEMPSISFRYISYLSFFLFYVVVPPALLAAHASLPELSPTPSHTLRAMGLRFLFLRAPSLAFGASAPRASLGSALPASSPLNQFVKEYERI